MRTVTFVRMTFEVGVTERHVVEFYFSKFWGGVKITVDGVVALRTVQLLSFSVVKRYNLTVGTSEQHAVTIEKRRALLFSAFRQQPVRAYVDGTLVAEGAA
ncbi:hypothetical protein ACWT_0388 [Actinoplanes sp. SE50]|nr:hypothetical protein ACPL_503 [Actinoplanes sp. SE50/110]ATO79803.1 hypothetical protein ACWT_0388 [Actinoplanes sp. SE50]SLL97205.1 hypothetical protein ACSP50_0402 [Actinoplanes sp. SE50/110]